MNKTSVQFTVEEMQPEDFVAANDVRLQSWLDTYVNDEAGVTREWIEARNEIQRSPEKVKDRLKKMSDVKNAQWVAKNNRGVVIGIVGPYVDNDGIQHVGSIYVNKEYHGTGVGAALMQKVVDWCDPTKPIVLGVATYNERAKAFYRKWGFVEIPDSETLFDNTIPEVMMVRDGDKQEVKNLNPKLEIKGSPIEGKGIFTKVSIKKGELVKVNINPQPVEVFEFTDQEFEEFRKQCIKNGLEWDSISVGNGRHRAAISDRKNHPDNFGNHSCDPNLDKNHVALRNIQAGEELTADYSEFSDINWEMKCHCGSKNCRGIVKGTVK